MLARANSEVVFNFMFEFINRAASISDPGVVSGLEPFREVSIHDEAAVNRRSMRRIIARRMKAAAFRA
jgi:hypothetical protein